MNKNNYYSLFYKLELGIGALAFIFFILYEVKKIKEFLICASIFFFLFGVISLFNEVIFEKKTALTSARLVKCTCIIVASLVFLLLSFLEYLNYFH